MKEKTFTKTFLFVLCSFVLLSFSSCDKVAADDYLEMLVGTWTSYAEWEDDAKVADEDLEVFEITFNEDYSFSSLIYGIDGAVDYTSGIDGRFSLHRNKIIGISDEDEDYKIDLYIEIMSISDTHMTIKQQGGFSVLTTQMEKTAD